MSDRRVKYTKMVLRESLLKLMADKPINKITIKEICESADVNRGTFYTHYNDQYDLLKQIQDEFASEVKELLSNRPSSEADSLDMITKVVTYFTEQRSLCKILFSDKGDFDFINRLMRNAYDDTLDEWGSNLKNPNPKRLEMIYSFLSNGSAAVIQKWVFGDMSEPPQDIARLIMQISKKGISGFE